MVAILNFGGHLGFLLVRQVLKFQILVHLSSQYAKMMQSIRTTTSNLSTNRNQVSLIY